MTFGQTVQTTLGDKESGDLVAEGIFFEVGLSVFEVGQREINYREIGDANVKTLSVAVYLPFPSDEKRISLK